MISETQHRHLSIAASIISLVVIAISRIPLVMEIAPLHFQVINPAVSMFAAVAVVSAVETLVLLRNKSDRYDTLYIAVLWLLASAFLIRWLSRWCPPSTLSQLHSVQAGEWASYNLTIAYSGFFLSALGLSNAALKISECFS